MDAPLEEIEFLALSANRVRVLEALTEESHTRRDLEELTGASQPTLARILNDFSERHWVEQTGHTYAATPLGTLVADGFTNLVEIMETEQSLRSVVQWLPAAEIDLDLRHFADATITTPSQTQPSAPIRRAVSLSRHASTHRILSYVFNRETLEATWEATVEGSQTFRAVFTPGVIETTRADPTSWERFLDLLACERASVRVSDAEVPYAMGIADETVFFILRDDGGLLRAVVETADEPVFQWATETLDRYWEAAEQVTRESVTETG
ncbi:helix-turn-helix transcriptional regulator [Haloferacaceae archaeon DSL9]